MIGPSYRRCVCVLVVLGAALSLARPADAFDRFKRVPNPQGRFAGQLLDFTANHGADHRLFSASLHEKRDLYVYLPPGFDPKKRYPFILWLHGMDQDEKGALEKGLPQLDAAMASGRFPPVIIAVPDGSIRGRPALFFSHSSFLNGRSGNYEDYLFDDVYDFVRRNFPLRPEREAHVLAGASLGGGSAFHHAIARRDQFGIVVGVFPPLNVRWVGSHGRYFANFDPDSWGWREHYHAGARPIGKFFGGLVSVPLRRVVHPLYGSGNQVISQMSRDNPIEMLDTHDVRPGELDMLVAYGGRDEFNIDAQVESFLYRSSERGLNVHVLYDPRGRHNAATAVRLLPGIHEWLAPRLERFHPDRVE